MLRADVWQENLRKLGLPSRATWSEVQDAYRQLVLSCHPDVNPSAQAAERFRQVAAAYEKLGELWREQRARSAEAWGQFRDDPRVGGLSAGELALRMRYSTSACMRSAAVHLLGRKGGDECRRVLLRESRAETDEAVQRAILEEVGTVGRPGDILRLLPLLLEGDGGLRLIGAFCGASVRIWRRTLRALRLSPWFLPSGRKNRRPSGG